MEKPSSFVEPARTDFSASVRMKTINCSRSCFHAHAAASRSLAIETLVRVLSPVARPAPFACAFALLALFAAC
jgi:hypothetical protein